MSSSQESGLGARNDEGRRLCASRFADLDEIYDYSEENWGYQQAEDYTFGLRETCHLVASGDKRGRRIERVKAGYLSLT